MQNCNFHVHSYVKLPAVVGPSCSSEGVPEAIVLGSQALGTPNIMEDGENCPLLSCSQEMLASI